MKEEKAGEDLALVLSGGGARAAYQVGVLCAIAERRPELSIPIHAGVSAGAINTITLAAHPGTFGASVRAVRREWSRLTVDDVYEVRMTGLMRAGMRWMGQRVFHRARRPTVVRGVFDMEPLRRFLKERVNVDRIDENVASGKLRAVTLSATCYDTSETVTFVHGAPDLTVWERSQRRAVRAKLTIDHVIASAAIPFMFPAVRLGDMFYGDGSVRQAAPLAPAIHLGARRILGISMRSTDSAVVRPPEVTHYPSAAQVMGMLFHSIFLDSLDSDAERLERLNGILAAVPPGGKLREQLRPIKLLVLRPSLDLGALARPHLRRLPTVVRSLVEGIGGQREGASDFISYLLFDPAYTVPLMELGYDDANDDWDRIEEFLDS
jgi:NTE family protein